VHAILEYLSLSHEVSQEGDDTTGRER
jgi:hypothetical protein